MTVLVFFGLVFLWATTTAVSSSIPTHLSNFTDHQALLSYKQHVSDPYGALESWNDSTSFCNWEGVWCSRRRQRVTALSLNDLGLGGVISPHVGNLSFLSFLFLQNNSFHGPMPHEIGRLRRLKSLSLAYNRLEGSIPASLGRCQELRKLILPFNNLDGRIPSEIGLLPRLVDLILGNNFLTGAIPPSLGNLTSLLQFMLDNNHLHGIIPNELGGLLNLQNFTVADNKLGGMVPSPLFNLSSLRVIDLGDNILSGLLPSVALPNLEWLIVNGNQLSGAIPGSLFNSSKVTFLSFSENSFNGPMPLTWGNFPRLEWLNLEVNQLEHEHHTSPLNFLGSLTHCRVLRILVLGSNPLGGTLPASVGNLSTHLERFTMQISQIQGSILAEIGNLTSLIQLSLRNNHLDGEIPSEIGNLVQLQVLSLSSNRLEGSIPASLARIENLVELHLFQNKLSGQVPAFLKNLTRLEILFLHYNKLSGKIPSGVWKCKNMLNLSFGENSLSGFLPSELGGLEKLVSFSASQNQLSGEIPRSLENLKMLIELDLSYNSFQGSIPPFSNLISIESMDISGNNLSGIIPKSLVSLRYLKFLNISFNNLEGEIPTGGVFDNLTFESFMGNPALCGTPRFHFPSCAANHTNTSKRKKIIIISSIAAALGFSILCYFCSVFQRKKLKKEKSTTSMFQPKEHRRISHHELLLATNNFNEANLLGVGNFGSAYKGALPDGTTIAAKVFNLQMERASKTSDKECNVLSRIRHRNLVQVITTCSNLEFKALILQFMHNGSLDKWLYPTNSGECELKLLQRLDIMIDVASAMEYLHHDYSRPIIHCDLKPSNVLLDEDMVAHVGDFGISRLVMKNHSITPTGTIGTIGYIAPEYGLGGRLSTSGDLYSYGILLLEMFTRKKPTDGMFTGDLNLPKWVDTALPHAVMEVVDEKLWREDGNENHMDRLEREQNEQLESFSSIMEIGLACARESIQERINMREASARLKTIRKDFVRNLEL